MGQYLLRELAIAIVGKDGAISRSDAREAIVLAHDAPQNGRVRDAIHVAPEGVGAQHEVIEEVDQQHDDGRCLRDEISLAV